MKINAWIQMGCERREVTFDVTDAEIEEVGTDGPSRSVNNPHAIRGSR